MIKKQADKKAIERIQRIFRKLETQSDIEGKPRSPLEATLIMNSITIEGILDCQDGIEKELYDSKDGVVARVTRLEERNKIITYIGSKVGLLIIGGIFLAQVGFIFWLLKELLKLKTLTP